MSTLYRPTGAYSDIRHKYDALYSEVWDKMLSLKKLTKYLRKLIESKKTQTEEFIKITNEFMEEEPMLKNHGGVVTVVSPLATTTEEEEEEEVEKKKKKLII